MTDETQIPSPAPVPAPASEPSPPPRSRARTGLWWGLGLLALVVLLVGGAVLGVLWAAGDARGSAWLLGRLARAGVGVQVVDPSGPLVGDFSARQVVVTAGRTKVVLDEPAWKGLSVDYASYAGTWARLKADALHARRVTITVAPGPASTAPARLPTDVRLPVEVDIERVSVDELNVPGLAGYPLREVSGKVHLGRDRGLRHEVDRLSLRAEPLRLTGHAHIAATGDLSLDVALDAVQAPPLANAPAPTLPAWARTLREGWQGTLRAKGPLADFATSVAVNAKGQSLDAKARVEPVAPFPLSRLDLATQAFDVSALWAEGPVTALSGTVRIDPVDPAKGASGGLRLQGALTNAKPGSWAERHVPVRRLTADVSGQATAAGPLDIASLEALLSDGQRDAGVLRAQGHWDAERFDLRSEIEAVRPMALHPSLPAMTLTGPVTASGTWPAAPDGTRPAVPVFTAGADLKGRLLDLDRAVQLKLDAAGDGQRVEVKSFQAKAGGAEAQVSGTAQRQASAWHVAAQSALVDFDPRPWFPGVPGAAWQAGPHRLNVRATADVTVPDLPAGQPRDALARAASVVGDVQVELTRSVLAGVPLTGSVGLTHDAAARPLQAKAVLDIDGNRVDAEGRLAPTGDGAEDRWAVKADVPVLARLRPLLQLVPAAVASGMLDALSGSLDAEAELNGRWPRISSSGTAEMGLLRAGPLAVQRGDVKWALGTAPDAPLDVTASIDQAGWAKQQAREIRLTLKGTPAAHDLSLETELQASPPAWADGLQTGTNAPPGASTHTRITAAARGALTGGLLAGANSADVPWNWKGLVQKIEVLSSHDGAKPWVSTRDVGLEVQTGASPRVVVSAGRADLFTAGVRWDRIEWQPNEGVRTQQLDMQAELEPLSVAPLLARAQPDFGWGGDLRIGGKVVLKQDSAFSADIVLERVGGDLTVTDDGGTQALGLTDLVLGLTVQDGVWTFTQGLAGKQLGVAAGAFVARTTPERAWPDANAPLQGVFEAQVENLGTWGAWVPTGWRLGGRVRTTAGLGGRFGAPEYTGRLIGEGISVRNILEGVNVTDGEVDIALQGLTARIQKFTARAGAGTLNLAGDAAFGEAPRAQLQVTADRFQLLGRVDRRIVVSGAGALGMDRDNVKVEGRFGVDEGLIDFTRSDAPTLGNDVVVTHRTENEPVEVAPPQRHRNVSIDVAIGLGDNLRLKGRGIDTGLAGDLRLTTPNGLPAFNGSIRTVGGTYAAYSQNLGIDRGVITFNGPVNDPRLDIEATRPDLDVRVGVAITGTALNPRVRLFSDPDMSDIDKLSWLMLGRASDGLGSSDTALLQRAAMAMLAGDSPGVTDQVLKTIGLDDLSVRQTDGETRDTVVSLGKQLSRRWYVGYERGLNATQGTWQLIYRIARRFTLRAQSGEDNSLDVIWTWRWD